MKNTKDEKKKGKRGEAWRLKRKRYTRIQEMHFEVVELDRQERNLSCANV